MKKPFFFHPVFKLGIPFLIPFIFLFYVFRSQMLLSMESLLSEVNPLLEQWLGISFSLWHLIGLFIGIFLAIQIFAFFGIHMVQKQMGFDKKTGQILETGQAANAKVLHLQDTGTTINDNPYVQLKLEVEPKGKPAYEVELKSIIPRLNIPQFQPGKVILVTIDPNDPMNVVLGAK